MTPKKTARHKPVRTSREPKDGPQIAERSESQGLLARETMRREAEEAVGGSVATPDQDRVDDIGNALGVPRAPDEEVRTSVEILEGRDRNRWGAGAMIAGGEA